MYRKFPPVAFEPIEFSALSKGRGAGVKVTLGAIHGGGGVDFHKCTVDARSASTPTQVLEADPLSP